MITAFHNLPVRYKLQLIGIFTMLLSICLSMSIIISGNAKAATNYMIQGLTTQAEIVAGNSAMALHFDDAVTAADILLSLQASPLLQAAQLLNQQQAVFASFQPENIHSQLPTIQVDVLMDNQILGALVFYYDLSHFHDEVWQQALTSGFIVFIMLLLAIWLQPRLLKLVTDPIDTLSALVNKVGKSQDYSLRSTIQRTDELGALARGLDTMLERIERYHHQEQVQAANKLSESESRYNTLVESVPVGVLQLNHQGQCDFANRMLWKILRSPTGKSEDLHLEQLASSKYQAALKQLMEQTLNGQSTEPLEFCLNGCDDNIWLAVEMNPLYSAEHQICGAVATVLDISERKQHEVELRLAASVFEASNDAILITNADGIILSSNQAFTRITEYQEADVLGKTPSFLSAGDTHSDFYGNMWRQLLQKGDWSGELVNRRKNGEPYYAWLSITAVRNYANIVTNYVGISRDITGFKQENDRIKYLAHYDGLTGLPNRTLFYDRARIEMARAERENTTFALMFIDLDKFKWVNDTLGHAVGDALLIEVAKRLTEIIRKSDTVARFGGDEFVLLISAVNNQQALALAQKLLRHVAGEAQCKGHNLSITPSIGLSMWTELTQDIDTLLKQADEAMYNAKREGRNCIHQYQPPRLLTPKYQLESMS
ncbi:MAG: diguanylate cyclase domain-containing protein [Shewanella sp.]